MKNVFQQYLETLEEGSIKPHVKPNGKGGYDVLNSAGTVRRTFKDHGAAVAYYKRKFGAKHGEDHAPAKDAPLDGDKGRKEQLVALAKKHGDHDYAKAMDGKHMSAADIAARTEHYKQKEADRASAVKDSAASVKNKGKAHVASHDGKHVVVDKDGKDAGSHDDHAKAQAEADKLNTPEVNHGREATLHRQQSDAHDRVIIHQNTHTKDVDPNQKAASKAHSVAAKAHDIAANSKKNDPKNYQAHLALAKVASKTAKAASDKLEDPAAKAMKARDAEFDKLNPPPKRELPRDAAMERGEHVTTKHYLDVKKGDHEDFYHPKTGEKKYGKVTHISHDKIHFETKNDKGEKENVEMKFKRKAN